MYYASAAFNCIQSHKYHLQPNIVFISGNFTPKLKHNLSVTEFILDAKQECTVLNMGVKNKFKKRIKQNFTNNTIVKRYERKNRD